MYKTLRAEMARKSINIGALSRGTGIRYATLAGKLRGLTPITLAEAVKIRDLVCPEMTLDELFND